MGYAGGVRASRFVGGWEVAFYVHPSAGYMGVGLLRRALGEILGSGDATGYKGCKNMHHVVQLWFFLLPRHHERWVYIKDPYLCCHKPYCTIGNRWNDSRGAVNRILAVNNGTLQYHGTFSISHSLQ
jgi:hypothetical protein